MKVHLLHINDVHSQLENYMRIGAQIRRLRDELQSLGETVVTVDLGDVIDRVRPETEATAGRVNAAMMQALSVEAWVFGNNEGLTVPKEQWSTLAEISGCPILVSNLRDKHGDRLKGFRDSFVVDIGTVRVGFFGLTPAYTHPYAMLEVEARVPHESAEEMVRKLRGSDMCDIIVCLSHLGLYDDRKLAESVSGIDVIIGGHTHQFMTRPERIGRTHIFQAGKFALAFGHTVIDVNERTREVQSIHCELCHAALHGPYDNHMLQAYHSYHAEIARKLESRAAVLSQPLTAAYDKESSFANVLVDAVQEELSCDCSVMMSGALTASLREGTVQVQHVLGACSTPTRPISVTMSGAALWDALQQGVESTTHLRPGFGYGFRGSVVGWLAVSQNVRVELKSGRVQAVWLDDKPIDKHKSYRVGICEYLWLAPVFQAFQNATNVTFYRPLVRELLVKKLEKGISWEQILKKRYQIL